MSVSATPFQPWDLERVFYGNPWLSKTERGIAVLIVKKCWDGGTWPVDSQLASQTLLGHWFGCWRSTVCRALRKLVALGYFRTTWKTVQRQTKQGWKGVTRVYVTPGPELEKLISPVQEVSAGQGRGVTSAHTSQPLQARPVAVSDSVIANSADRTDASTADKREDRRKTLADWPRLAGSKPISASRLPSAVPYTADFADKRDGADLPSYTELSDEEAAARLQQRRVAAAAKVRAEIAAPRKQPRRKPRSKR